jgi:hypothetical protein
VERVLHGTQKGFTLNQKGASPMGPAEEQFNVLYGIFFSKSVVLWNTLEQSINGLRFGVEIQF